MHPEAATPAQGSVPERRYGDQGCCVQEEGGGSLPHLAYLDKRPITPLERATCGGMVRWKLMYDW